MSIEAIRKAIQGLSRKSKRTAPIGITAMHHGKEYRFDFECTGKNGFALSRSHRGSLHHDNPWEHDRHLEEFLLAVQTGRCSKYVVFRSQSERRENRARYAKLPTSRFYQSANH